MTRPFKIKLTLKYEKSSDDPALLEKIKDALKGDKIALDIARLSDKIGLNFSQLTITVDAKNGQLGELFEQCIACPILLAGPKS